MLLLLYRQFKNLHCCELGVQYSFVWNEFLFGLICFSDFFSISIFIFNILVTSWEPILFWEHIRWSCIKKFEKANYHKSVISIQATNELQVFVFFFCLFVCLFSQWIYLRGFKKKLLTASMRNWQHSSVCSSCYLLSALCDECLTRLEMSSSSIYVNINYDVNI